MTTIANAEVKLDQWGMGAWIALMVLGFLPLVAGGSGDPGLRHMERTHELLETRRRRRPLHGRDAMRDPAGWFRPSSGNHAFDEYRTETLRRLEEEQREFKEFLERLRFAKDKTEFDQFMAERRNRSWLVESAAASVLIADVSRQQVILTLRAADVSPDVGGVLRYVRSSPSLHVWE